jgi:hypothetical protein
MGFKVVIGTAVITVSLLILFASWLLSAQPRQAAAGAVERSNIACTLNPAQQGDRRNRFASLKASAREITELDNGYALRFDLDEPAFREATNLVFDESQCCGFFEFRLAVLPSLKSLTLEVTGPQGAKEFLAANVGFESVSVKPQLPACACQSSTHCSADRCQQHTPPDENSNTAE